jgi:hypothetical protein
MTIKQILNPLHLLRERNQEAFRETDLIKDNPKTLPKGMRIEGITTEYQGTGEEHQFAQDY